MKKIKLLCLLMTFFMLMTIQVFADDVPLAVEHLHDENCQHDSNMAIEFSVDESIVIPDATCWFGHWFTTTTYGNGGACFVNYNITHGTNYQCYIVLYKIVTCNYCGTQISHEEVERTYGACLFLENH